MTDVVMPQMGESIAEGTIVRWIKKVGDRGRTRRAAVRDLDRQGRRRDPVAGGRRHHRDPRQGRRDGSGQHRRRRHRRSRLQPRRPLRRQPLPPRRRLQRRRALRLRLRQPRPCRCGRFGGDGRPQRHGPLSAGHAAASVEDVIRQRSSPLVRKIAQGAQRRHLADSGHRHRRPRDQGRHPGSCSRTARRRRCSASRRAAGAAAVLLPGTPAQPRAAPPGARRAPSTPVRARPCRCR